MTYLSNERKKDMIGQRLTQCESEKYQHEINLKIAQSLEKEQDILQAQSAIEILEKSIEIYMQELAVLNSIQETQLTVEENNLGDEE